MEQSAKVDRFVEAIIKESEKKRQLIEQETQQIIKDEISKCEAELRRESYNYIQKRAAAIREDVGREIANRQLESRKELLLRRTEMMEEIFVRVKLRLSAFTQTPEYTQFLLRSMEKLRDTISGGIILYVRPADVKILSEIAGSLLSDYKIEEDSSISIGGVKASDMDKKIFADDTLDIRIHSQREWFMANSGLNVE